MATADQAGDVVDGCLGDRSDRLTDLPDHLLHRILIRLPNTADAARTSVLSRRWRRVWFDLPELALRYGPTQASPSPRVDAALDACSTPVLDRLEISVTPTNPDLVTSERISSWLRFASRRVAGELRLSLPRRSRSVKQDVVLPLCERLTAISLTSLGHALRFQAASLPGAGAFAALASLTIEHARVDGRELEDILSSRCPRLKELDLAHIFVEDRDHPVLSIRSGSLERLRVYALLHDDCLQVSTPELRALHLPCVLGDAHIVAPKLSEVRWGKYSYDPSQHQFAEVGRHLRRLEVVVNSSAAVGVMGRFDTADELTLNINVSEGVYEYERFLEGTKEVAKCEVLVVRFVVMVHAFQPLILHLLRKCGGIRKLVVQLGPMMGYPCQLPNCPCCLPKNRDPTYAIALDSLQEVEVEEGGLEDLQLELLRMLYGCSAVFQKKVSIAIPVDKRNWYMRRKINRLLLHRNPSDRVQLAIRYTVPCELIEEAAENLGC